MLKTWILKGRRPEDEMYRAMWERAIDDMIDRLVTKNNATGLNYVASISPLGALVSQMEHLTGADAHMLADVRSHAHSMAPGLRVRFNALRAEAMEAAFYLWRVIGKQLYQDWAWLIFHAFEQNCKVAVGYAGVRDVTTRPAVNDDSMPSLWLVEMLKYAWLVFSPPEALDLDAFVLNTEAHSLCVLGHMLPSQGTGRAAASGAAAFFF
ncbi:hypothetical protein WJX81_003645 [Elliptochloris bilobata]|uniref:alpha-1,2-Mannosidase n=1 Tax=Elliptochloris bilobata TaxID=381761 RepID=A0AAW1S4W0_9CHLO